MPLAAFQTGRYRITQIYVCRYGGYQRGYNSNKIECPCHLKYEIKDGKTSLVSADWNHNHPVLSNQNSLFDKDAFKKSAQHSNATHFLICIQCFECPQVFVRKYAHSIYNSIDSKKNVFFL